MDATTTNANTLIELATALGLTNGSALGSAEGYLDMNQLGALLGNASSVIDTNTAGQVLNNMGNQISSDFQSSGDTWAILFKAINFSSVGQILATTHTPLDGDQLNTLGSDLATAVDPTGVGYFLGNFTTNYHLATFGGMINQLLNTIDFTQIGVLVEGLPKVVTNIPATFTSVGNQLESANFTDAGSAVSGYVGSLGTLIAGCGDSVNDTNTYTMATPANVTV